MSATLAETARGVAGRARLGRPMQAESLAGVAKVKATNSKPLFDAAVEYAAWDGCWSR